MWGVSRFRLARRARAVVVALLVVAALVAGCGDDDGPAVDPDAGLRADSGTMGGDVCAPASGPVALAGQWAIRGELQVELLGRPDAFIHLCPDPQMATASFVMKATITGSGTSLGESLQLCDIGLPLSSGGVASCPMDPADNLRVSVTVGSRLRDFLPTVGLFGTATLSGAVGGASFTAEPFAFVAGAMLASPMTDPLPSWDTSITGCQTFDPMPTPTACVTALATTRDDDTDMQLGVTLDAVSNDAAMVLHGAGYAVLRLAPALAGTVRNANCVEGTLDGTLEYSLVDSDVILSGVAVETPALINNLPVIDVRPTSTFRMLRADGSGANDFDDDSDGTVTCVEISRHGLSP